MRKTNHKRRSGQTQFQVVAITKTNHQDDALLKHKAAHHICDERLPTSGNLRDIRPLYADFGTGVGHLLGVVA